MCISTPPLEATSGTVTSVNIGSGSVSTVAPPSRRVTGAGGIYVNFQCIYVETHMMLMTSQKIFTGTYKYTKRTSPS
jgi:hypothetical protein